MVSESQGAGRETQLSFHSFPCPSRKKTQQIEKLAKQIKVLAKG